MISDEELKRRLKAHNYAVPPITDSTRNVLLKKLHQLDNGNENKSVKSATASVNGKNKQLLEYSSADDDETAEEAEIAMTSSVIKRRKRVSTNSSTSHRNGRRSTTPSNKVKNGYSSSWMKHSSPSSSSTTSRRRRTANLMRHSETEEEEEQDAEDDDVVDVYEEDYRRELAIQTSPGLDPDNDDVDEEDDEEEREAEEEEEEDEDEDDNDDEIEIGVDNKGGSRLMNSLRFRSSSNNRFMDSTPSVSPIRSTASYLARPSSSSSSSSVDFSPLSSSALRKQIAKNKESFGSLGEALSSLPRLCSTNSSLTSATNGGLIVTQAQQQQQQQQPLQQQQQQHHYKSKTSNLCNSHSISKIIIWLAGIFFFVLAFKYSNLRPNPDIAHRIVLCDESKASLQSVSCVKPESADALMTMYKNVVQILEEKAFQSLCNESTRNNESSTSSSLSVQELIQSLKDRQATNYDETILQRLLELLRENPQWGIVVSEDKSDLTLNNPPIDWSCWFSLKIGFTYIILCTASLWTLKASIVALVLYGLYRWRNWYRERKLREHQDIFELVEHVLSILATQNTLVMREGRGNGGAYIAINHIRDQLILPQDRARKKRLWDKVVKYIRESESRVREDVQNIYGEETRVWRWIPDIRWGNSLSQHGPNPYVPAVTTPTRSPLHSPSPSSTSSSPQQHPPSCSSSSTTPSSSLVSSPSTSPQWQGSAFNSLNKNVAAPQVAPTTCLKVRHMFDQQTIQNNPNGWVWRVKEEILRRCAGTATILHVAVDKQSPEGCVYIKAVNTEGAGNIFKCLHGQWYRGNLVTVKYLREERYHERFQDAKNARTPLTPETK